MAKSQKALNDEIKAKFDSKKAALQDNYDSNHVRWAGEIYKRVIY